MFMLTLDDIEEGVKYLMSGKCALYNQTVKRFDSSSIKHALENPNMNYS